MRGLVVDTALGLCTAAVFEDGRPIAVRSEAMDRGHQERLAGLVRDAVAEAGGFHHLSRIGVTVGPGSFTGLRVGLAFAQGLGAALDLPVVGVSTLDALIASVPESGPVAALIDARRGQVYARFRRDDASEGEAEALGVEDAADRIAAFGPQSVLVGSGAALFADRFADTTIRPLAGPTPEGLVRAVIAADPDRAPPRPLYLRAPDATPPTRAPGQPRPARV